MDLEKLKLKIELLKAKTDLMKIKADDRKYSGVLSLNDWDYFDKLKKELDEVLKELEE